MKKVLIIISVLVLVSSIVYAESSSTIITSDSSGTSSLASTFSNGLTMGYIKEGSSEVGVLAWKPDWKMGPWGVGLDINIPTGNQATNNIQNIVFRYAEYDDGAKGLRYGVLDNVTLGHGLIMNNYSTRNLNYAVLNNDQVGLKGYYDWDKYGVGGMSTYTHVYYVTLKEKLHPRLILTEYYVTDADGVNIIQTDGTTRNFAQQSGFGIDATVPIIPGWDLFAEAGQLSNYGNGYSAGSGWALDFIGLGSATFMASYRMLDKAFVPGYFNVDYESNPIDLTSSEAGSENKNGYLVQLSATVLDRGEVTISYEDYKNSNPALTGLASAVISKDVSATAYYQQPNFSSIRAITLEEGAIIGGSVTYKVNPFTSMTVHYKKAYNSDTGQVEETQYYEIGLSF